MNRNRTSTVKQKHQKHRTFIGRLYTDTRFAPSRGVSGPPVQGGRSGPLTGSHHEVSRSGTDSMGSTLPPPGPFFIVSGGQGLTPDPDLRSLLMLGGDIEPNPGPSCYSCNRPIRRGTDPLVCASGCGRVCHIQEKCSGHRRSTGRPTWTCSPNCSGGNPPLPPFPDPLLAHPPPAGVASSPSLEGAAPIPDDDPAGAPLLGGGSGGVASGTPSESAWGQ